MQVIAEDREQDRISRALRELDSARARVERDARAVADETRRDLVAQLLPLLDNLDRTIAAAEREGDAPAVVDGVRLVRGQLEATLRGYGLVRVDVLDDDFDPALHDAIALAPTDAAGHGRIVDQLEPAYRYGNSVLRPAKVVVGRYDVR